MSQTTQTAEPSTTIQPSAKVGNGKGANRPHRKAAPAQAAAAANAAETAAAAKAAIKPALTAAQIAARATNITKGREARAQSKAGTNSGMGPSAISALCGELPGQGGKWSATEALSFIEAFCPLMCHEYRLGGRFTVTYTPGAG